MPSLAAKASFKKLNGLLELTTSHLQWTEAGKASPAVRILSTTVSNLFASKEGSAQVKLKVVVQAGDDAGYMFTFTSPQALAEREKFKTELTSFMSGNRANDPVAAKTLKNPKSPISVHPTPPRPVLATTGATASPALALPRTSQTPSRPLSISNDKRAATPVIVGNDPVTDFRMRKTVLMGNPELLTLHRELVMTGQITEAEFWEGREYLLLAQAASEQQKKGKSGQIVDPKPQDSNGEQKYIMTPQLQLDIFDEYPVVKKAYDENVPSKMNESEFWARYFVSKLHDFHQASVRSTHVQHVRKSDSIFDKYLQKADDGLEPIRRREDNVDRLVDLGSTNEDHGETWSEKDITMQAGRQKSSLPLIRKFNEHSERLLNTSLGEGPSKRRKLDDNESTYSQIEIDDLRGSEEQVGIRLDVQDRHRYFEGRATIADGQNDVNMEDAVQTIKFNMNEWSATLPQLRIEKKAGDNALLTMTKSVAARSDTRSRQTNFPEDFLRQLTSCQTATIEFLRQYWSAIFPQVQDLSTASTPQTPAQREVKLSKMMGYLVKTPDKIDALVIAGQKRGIDGESVKAAMKPALDSVERAVSFHQTRKPLR